MNLTNEDIEKHNALKVRIAANQKVKDGFRVMRQLTEKKAKNMQGQYGIVE